MSQRKILVYEKELMLLQKKKEKDKEKISSLKVSPQSLLDSWFALLLINIPK
jgi:hypothetical protein